MIADAALCAIAAAAYLRPAQIIAGDVHVLTEETGGVLVISFRGTVPSSWLDWFRDCAAWPVQVRDHPQVGLCHAGFIGGAEDVLDALLGLLTPARDFVLCGHSLGGALAIATAALLTEANLFPLQLTTFGAPRVGMSLGARLSGIPGRRYRCGDDPVVEVPTWPYRHDRALTDIGLPLADPIADHAIAAYAAALAAVPSAPPI